MSTTMSPSHASGAHQCLSVTVAISTTFAAADSACCKRRWVIAYVAPGGDGAQRCILYTDSLPVHCMRLAGAMHAAVALALKWDGLTQHV
jgi:hypothetical protein